MSAILLAPIRVLLALALLGYVFLLLRSGLSKKFLKRCFLVILSGGTAVYMFGFLHQSTTFGFITVMVHSFILAVQMFLGIQQMWDLKEACRIPLYTDVFNVFYIAALMTSVSTLIALFGRRLKTRISLRFSMGRKYKHVFLAPERGAKLLTKSIGYENGVAFILLPDDKEEAGFSVSGIVQDLINPNTGKKSSFDASKVTYLYGKKKIADLDRGSDVLDELGLGLLKKSILPETAFYLFSEDYAANIACLMILEEDPVFKSHMVHIRMKDSGIYRLYEDVFSNANVHFVYPASLGVMDLKRIPECNPISVMDVYSDESGQSNGTVSGEFNALIVGFSETGQAVARFIYEYMFFSSPDGKPLPCKLYIQDEDIESKQGEFLATCPEASYDDRLVFEQAKANSSAFWRGLAARGDKLNYIVIATENELDNLELAGSIINVFEPRRYGKFDNLKIMVHKWRTPRRQQTIIDSLNAKCGHNVVYTFGEYKKVFTKEMMVSDNLWGIDSISYSGVLEMSSRYETVVRDPIETIEAIRSKYIKAMRDNDKAAINACHRHISRYTEAYWAMTSFLQLVHGVEDRILAIPQSLDDYKEDAVVEILAKTEYMRNRALLIMLGYTPGRQKDDLNKESTQMGRWEDLSEERRHFYRLVIKAMCPKQSND